LKRAPINRRSFWFKERYGRRLNKPDIEPLKALGDWHFEGHKKLE
jgi:hypothetical protein